MEKSELILVLGGDTGRLQLFCNYLDGTPVGGERHKKILQDRLVFSRVYITAIFLLRWVAESSRDLDKPFRR